MAFFLAWLGQDLDLMVRAYVAHAPWGWNPWNLSELCPLPTRPLNPKQEVVLVLGPLFSDRLHRGGTWVKCSLIIPYFKISFFNWVYCALAQKKPTGKNLSLGGNRAHSALPLAATHRRGRTWNINEELLRTTARGLLFYLEIACRKRTHQSSWKQTTYS